MVRVQSRSSPRHAPLTLDTPAPPSFPDAGVIRGGGDDSANLVAPRRGGRGDCEQRWGAFASSAAARHRPSFSIPSQRVRSRTPPCCVHFRPPRIAPDCVEVDARRGDGEPARSAHHGARRTSVERSADARPDERLDVLAYSIEEARDNGRARQGVHADCDPKPSIRRGQVRSHTSDSATYKL